MKVEEVIKPFTIDGFLSRVECEELISKANSIGFKEAKVGFPDGQLMVKGIRNNQRIEIQDQEFVTCQGFSGHII